MHQSNERNTSIHDFQTHKLEQTQTMGTTNTLADYMVHIRTEREVFHSSKNNSKRWGCGKENSDATNRPNSSGNKRRQNLKNINSTKKKRTKTVVEPTRTSTASSPSKRRGMPGGRMRIPKLPGCTLQPHFTKDSPIQLHRDNLQHKDYHEHFLNRKLCIQYQFEFPPNLLDDDSRIGLQRNARITLSQSNDMIESVSKSSSSSIISQITQDSSLEDEDCDDECSGVMGGYGDDSGHEQKSNSRALNLLESKTNLYVTTAEVQEGARLLLKLFSTQ